MLVIRPFSTTPEELSNMSIEELREITADTRGIVYHCDSRERLLAVLIKNIKDLKRRQEYETEML